MPILQNVLDYWPIVDKWCVQLQVSQSLVFAVIQRESAGKPDATRHEPAYEKKYIAGNPERLKQCERLGITTKEAATSYGLMQLMFFTAHGYGAKRPGDLLDPDQNIRFGVAHLSALLKTYDGDKALALAAYNGGHGGAKALQEGRNTAACKYSKAVMKLYHEYREAMVVKKPTTEATVASGAVPPNHFAQKEISCKCGCQFVWADPRLMYTLNAIREYIGLEIVVTSGCRCTEHNKKVGGVTDTRTVPMRGAMGDEKDSNHTRGQAADITCRGMSAKQLHAKILELWAAGGLPHLAGLGLYVKKNFVHVDIFPVVAGRLREWTE